MPASCAAAATSDSWSSAMNCIQAWNRTASAFSAANAATAALSRSRSASGHWSQRGP